MKVAVYTFTVALIALGAAVTWTVIRGEDTRRDLRVVERRITVDPCKEPQSVSCQRRIRLVLKELVTRHPKLLKELGLRIREPQDRNLTSGPPPAQGGGAPGSPNQGSGPTGRVNVPPRHPPAPPTPEPPAPPKPPAPVDLDVPLPVDVCVGELVRINC